MRLIPRAGVRSAIITAVGCLLLVLARPAIARAQAPARLSETNWLLNGAPLGAGRAALLGEFGWPGLSLAILSGQSDRVDLGGYFDFNFGFEGIPDYGAVPGFRVGGLARLSFTHGGRVNFGLRFSPGLLTYFFPRTFFGLTLPVEFVGGVLATPALSINFGVALPFTFRFVHDFGFVFPIEPGLGFEYRFDPAVSVGLDLRLGPALVALPFSSFDTFAFRALAAVGYRF